MLSLGLLGAGSTAAVGLWAYETARDALLKQVDAELETVGRILEKQTASEVRTALLQMQGLAAELGKGPKAGLAARGREALREAQALHLYLLQLRLTDAKSNVLAERGSRGAVDPINRVAIATSLDGGAYASAPFFAPAFGRYVLNLTVPVRAESGEIVGALGARYDVERELQDLTRTARFAKTGMAVVVGSDGKVIAHPEPGRAHEDVSGSPAVDAALRGRSGSLVAENRSGLARRFFYQPLKTPSTQAAPPLALLTEIDESEVASIVGALRWRILAAALAVGLAGLLAARLISERLDGPLRGLGAAARRVADGDLEGAPAPEAGDEIGRLGKAFNAMVAGLRDRERVRSVFGQYVATQVSERVLRGEVPLGGESRRVTILFSDIRGFTSMAERMPPAEVVKFLNEYFSEMVEAVFEQNGMLDKFIGDGIMAVFGAFGEDENHARSAVRCALRMKSLLGKLNAERAIHGKPPIEIGVGVHTDEVVLGNIGSRKRVQYTAVGDGVNICARVEALNKELGTTILITEATHELVKESFDCRPARDASLKGKSTTLKFYEVLSERG
jgi:class 3 adenylate cyclase